VSIIAGKTFSVVSLGCRTNHYEAEALASALEQKGAVFLAGEPGPADIVLILTCSVTSVADAKTRKILRRARRNSPSAAIAACGCSAQELSEDSASLLGVDIVVGSRVKHKLPDALETWFESRCGGDRGGKVIVMRDEALSENHDWDSLSLDMPRIRTRAFIKVQDGCSRSCSYCIVPRARGAESSRNPDEVREEIARTVESGCPEAILTGIRLGGYRYGDIQLAGLIESVLSIPGLKRLRLGSLEPFAVNEDLLNVLSASPVFCPHLHLPIQSGDDGVLLRMRRGYDAAAFLRTVESVRRYLGEDVHISTDLIVGFPHETDAAFERSMKVLEEAGFGRVHVFPFSPRDGTAAAGMEGRVAPSVIRQRVKAAVELSKNLLSMYASGCVGREESALIEETFGKIASGWTRRYVRACVSCREDESKGGEVLFNPKSEFRGILLGDGVSPEDIAGFSYD
jgi:threonylcarbamoyladenosine tRNA methylthiotransferase MtaB